MKGICLCSGGLDSTLALLKLLKEGHSCVPMFVDYNQWPLEKELDSVQDIYHWIKRTEEFTSTLDSLVGTSIDLDRDIDLQSILSFSGQRVGSVWGRNIALVGLAAMWAYTHGNDYDFIASGNHKGDVGPDCKPAWCFAFNQVVQDATKGQIKFLLPIADLTVEDIGRELAEFGVPWNLMYSCYWETPCGYRSPHDSYRCPGCRRKVIAMWAAGVTDKKLLELPNCKEITYQSPLAEDTGY